MLIATSAVFELLFLTAEIQASDENVNFLKKMLKQFFITRKIMFKNCSG